MFPGTYGLDLLLNLFLGSNDRRHVDNDDER